MDNSNKITVLFFGQLVEIVNDKQQLMDWQEELTSLQLVKQLMEQYPELNTVNFSIAINQQLVTKETKINKGDTVALLPPFAGG